MDLETKEMLSMILACSNICVGYHLKDYEQEEVDQRKLLLLKYLAMPQSRMKLKLGESIQDSSVLKELAQSIS